MSEHLQNWRTLAIGAEGEGSGNDSGESGNGSGDGQGQGQQQGQQQQAGQSQAIDLKSLDETQLQQVLENPNLWKLPRVQELVTANKELKTLKTEQQKAEEKRLEENNEHKTLAEQRKADLEAKDKTIQDMQINQALMTKLAPEGVVDLEAALKLIDRSKIKIEENGSISGVDESLESLKKDKSYLFNNSGNQTQSLGSASKEGQQGQSGPAKFKRSQLRDRGFYQANREEILKAQAAGLIEDDLSQ